MVLGLEEGVEDPEAELQMLPCHLLEPELHPESADEVDDLAEEVALPRGQAGRREAHVVALEGGPTPSSALEQLRRELGDHPLLGRCLNVWDDLQPELGDVDPPLHLLGLLHEAAPQQQPHPAEGLLVELGVPKGRFFEQVEELLVQCLPPPGFHAFLRQPELPVLDYGPAVPVYPDQGYVERREALLQPGNVVLSCCHEFEQPLLGQPLRCVGPPLLRENEEP